MATPHPALFLATLALASTAGAQTGWVQRLVATPPPPRAFHALAYDLLRGTTVMFGGQNPATLGDTWEWDGVTWTQRVTPNSPSPRAGHALAHDIYRGRVVLFGGTTGTTADLNDTWEYDGATWTLRLPPNSPSQRREVRMAYDLARSRTVLFGGGTGPGGQPLFGDTWEWNGIDWTQRSPTTSPLARWSHGMTYDFALSRIVLFGGAFRGFTPLADTWTWNGTTWTQVQAIQSPPPSTYTALAADATPSFVVQFGGYPNGAETWLLDDDSWRRDPRSIAPSPRASFTLAYDLLRDRTVLFGGFTAPSTYHNDTWEYDPGVVAQWAPFGSGCAGTAGVPTLQPVDPSLPIVGSAFVVELLGVPGNVAAISIGFSDQQWGTNTLPWSLSALGMTGCTLHSSPDFVFFTPASFGRATLSWPLPNNAVLIGTRFFDQGFVLDPGVNALGAVVSNAGAGTLGPF